MQKACPIAGWNLQEAFDVLVPDHLKTELRAMRKAVANARTKDALTPSVLEGGNLDEKAAARDGLKRMEAMLVSSERAIEQWLEDHLNVGNGHASGRIGSIFAERTGFAPYSWANVRVFYRGHNEAMVPCDAMLVEADKQTPIYDLRIFDVPPGAAEARARAARKAAKGCFEWLCEQMKASPTKKPKPKAAFWHEARELWPDLSHASFKNQWDLACKATPNCNWINAGRPRKSTSGIHQDNKIEETNTDVTAPPS